jgi:DNA-binding XRE family transcriptional regulator
MKNLQRLREMRGWSPYRLQMRSGVCRATIVACEDGTRDARLTSAIQLADALHCSLDELVGRTVPAEE